MITANVKVEALIDIMTFRRDRFSLVSDVFTRETSEESLSQMIARVAEFGEQLDESLEHSLSKSLLALPREDFSTFATFTRTEYARLFIGPRKVLAPLHESAYLSGVSRMFTLETLAVRRFYECFGYMMKAKNTEPEDGIGVELEFLRNLCDRCIALLEGPLTDESLDEFERLLDAQKTFKEQHLLRWVDSFAGLVVAEDNSGYYAAWANYLSGVVAEDADLLAECVEVFAELKGPLKDDSGAAEGQNEGWGR
ncbi:MAG: molecular chaperone [Coriobacteriia bacterium]